MDKFLWERSGDMFSATVESPEGVIIFHLVVERLNHHWDWAVWRPEEPVTMARQGVADSIQEAMRQAEQAVG
jgi:hypothetical protein